MAVRCVGTDADMCQGFAIGDITNTYCALYTIYQCFRDLIETLPSLWQPNFNSLSDAQLMNELDEILYGHHGDTPVDDDRSEEQLLQDWQTYRKVNFLMNWGKQFDQYGKTFIVCTPAQQVRILNQSFADHPGSSMHAFLFAVVRAAKDFRCWFAQEAARRGIPSGINVTRCAPASVLWAPCALIHIFESDWQVPPYMDR